MSSLYNQISRYCQNAFAYLKIVCLGDCNNMCSSHNNENIWHALHSSTSNPALDHFQLHPRPGINDVIIASCPSGINDSKQSTCISHPSQLPSHSINIIMLIIPHHPHPHLCFQTLFLPITCAHVMIRFGEESRLFGPRLSALWTFAFWLIGWSNVSYGLWNMHTRSCAGSPSSAQSFNDLCLPITCIHVMIRFGEESRLFGPRLSALMMMFLYVRQRHHNYARIWSFWIINKIISMYYVCTMFVNKI